MNVLGELHLSIAKHICLWFNVGKRLQLIFIQPVLLHFTSRVDTVCIT